MNRPLAIMMATLPSAIRVALLRMFFGAKVSKGAHIGMGCVLHVAELDLGPDARIRGPSYVRCRQLTMGGKARIGAFTYISVDTLVMHGRSTIDSRVDVAGSHDRNGRIEIGSYSWIFPYCYVNVTRPITIGRNVGVGGGSYLFTHGFWLSKLDGFPVAYGGVVIGDNTWLPWGCFVMPGVEIGQNVIVGARSVVTKSIPDDVVVAGAPAKVIRDRSRTALTQAEKSAIFEMLVREYAAAQGKLIGRTTVQDEVNYSLDGVPFIALRDGEPSEPHDKSILCVCWAPVSDTLLRATPSWSLADYRSSSENLLTTDMKTFLTYGRTIGLRYFPVDEPL